MRLGDDPLVWTGLVHRYAVEHVATFQKRHIRDLRGRGQRQGKHQEEKKLCDHGSPPTEVKCSTHVGSLSDNVDHHDNLGDGTSFLALNPVASLSVSGPVRCLPGLRPRDPEAHRTPPPTEASTAGSG